MNIEEQAEIFKALGHPTRLRIVQGLMTGDCNVSTMAEKLQIPQPTISQHIGILRQSGILSGERHAEGICYKVVHPMVLHIFE